MKKLTISILTVLLTMIPWLLTEARIIELVRSEIRVCCVVSICINGIFLASSLRKNWRDFDDVAPLAACLGLVGIPGAMLTSNLESFIWLLFSAVPAGASMLISLLGSKRADNS